MKSTDSIYNHNIVIRQQITFRNINEHGLMFKRSGTYKRGLNENMAN